MPPRDTQLLPNSLVLGGLTLKKGVPPESRLESAWKIVARDSGTLVSCGIVVHMKSTNPTLVVGLAVLLGAVAAGCAAALCQPGEPSVNCCIKKFPLSPVESCGVTEAEALEVLSGLWMA
jgi:hypothetical protein